MEKNEIVIMNSDGKTLTLQSSQLVNGMIETDGQEYLITYEENMDFPEQKRVSAISLIK